MPATDPRQGIAARAAGDHDGIVESLLKHAALVGRRMLIGQGGGLGRAGQVKNRRVTDGLRRGRIVAA